MFLWDKVVIAGLTFSFDDTRTLESISSVTLDFSGNQVTIGDSSYSIEYLSDYPALRFEIVNMLLGSGIDIEDSSATSDEYDKENYDLLNRLLMDKKLVEVALNQRRDIMASIGRDDNYIEYSKVYDATDTW